MTKEELRQEYLRLTNLSTLKDCNDLAEIFLEYFSGKGTSPGANVLTVPHKDGDHYRPCILFVPGKPYEPIQFNGVSLVIKGACFSPHG